MHNLKKNPTGPLILLLVLLTLCLTGCGGKEEGNTTPTGQTTPVKETETPPSMTQTAESTAEPSSETSAETAETDIPTDSETDSSADNTKTANQETASGQTEETRSDQPETAEKEPPEGWELTLASEDWGLSFGEPGTRPVGNAKPEDLAWYDAYYMGDAEEKVIYLTFDCGYENGNTEPILAALKKHDVKATFFVTGAFLESAPDMTKRIVEEGHTVGNHTYNHPDMASISDMESFQKELDDVADLFYETTGTELSPYYRPPRGKCNAENLKMAQELGYATVFWSLAHVDWDQENQPDHQAALDKLTQRVHPGAVVLLHAISQTNGEILDQLLTEWENMGYEFRTLADLTGK